MKDIPYDIPYRVVEDGNYGLRLKFMSTEERDSFELRLRAIITEAHMESDR